MAVPILNKCLFCEGFGFWPGESIQITHEEAVQGISSDECWNCGSDNSFYEIANEHLEETFEVTATNMDSLKDFDKICAEL